MFITITRRRSRSASRTTRRLAANAAMAVLAAAPLFTVTPTASAAACPGVEVVFARGNRSSSWFGSGRTSPDRLLANTEQGADCGIVCGELPSVR